MNLEDGSFPSNYFSFDGDLFFSAVSGRSQDLQLWSYDNDTKSNFLHDDLSSNTAFGRFENASLFEGDIYFSREGPLETPGLWKYSKDGGVSHVGLGTRGTAVSDIEVFNGALYMIVSDDLWRFDGGDSSPYSYTEFDAYRPPQFLTVAQNKIFFGVERERDRLEIWASDGQSPADSLAADFGMYDLESIISSNDQIIISGRGGMFSFDGTGVPEEVTTDTGDGNFWVDVRNVVDIDGVVYFAGFRRDTGSEIYSYDGVNAPILVADLDPGQEGTYPSNFTKTDRGIYFTRDFRSYRRSIGLIDENGVAQDVLLSTEYGISTLYEHEGAIYFAGWDQKHGIELWTIGGDGVPKLASDINSRASSSPDNLTVFKDDLYFTVKYDSASLKMLRNGRITDIELNGPNSSDHFAMDLYEDGEFLYITVGTLDYGSWNDLEMHSIYKYDGAGTADYLARINLSRDNHQHYFDGQAMLKFKDALYFAGDNGQHGHELWSYDEANGARMVADLYKPFGTDNSSEPRDFFVYQDSLYFSARGGPWNYSPDIGATAIGGRWGSFYTPIPHNNSLLFASFDNLSELNSQSDPEIIFEGSRPYRWLSHETGFYFLTIDSNDMFDLWKYDGTNPPVRLDVEFPDRFFYMDDMAVINNLLCLGGPKFYCIDLATSEIEEYVIADEYRQASISNFTHFDGDLYFSADDGETGQELWKFSPGAAPVSNEVDIPESQFVVSDVYPNPSSGLAKISIQSEKTQLVEIKVYDLFGRSVIEKTNVVLTSGVKRTLRFDLNRLANGQYFVKLQSSSKDIVRPLIHLK